MTDDGKERISSEGYSVTADEKRDLHSLRAGAKTAEQIADDLTADLSSSN